MFCFTFLVLAIFLVLLGLSIFLSVDEDREIALIPIILGPTVFVIVAGFMLYRTNKIIRDKAYAIKLTLKSVANKILIEENIGAFTIDKELVLNTDSGFSSQKILIDNTRKLFVYFDGQNYSKKNTI